MARTAESPAHTIPEPQTESANAWIRQASDMVVDLQRRSALIYWTDFLLSCTTGWLLALYWFTAPLTQPLAWLAPLASAPPVETIKYILQTPVLPVLTVLRFGVGAPISWFNRGVREWLLTAASAGVINPYYRKRFAKSDERHLLIVEILCFTWLVLLGALLAKGVITWVHLARAYALLGVAVGLNWVRNLAAHKYGNYGERMTLAEQLNDSINITGQTWLTMLLFPVGLRYHALHHLLPGLPYHNMGRAHARLSERLPADCPYHAVNQRSYFSAVATLWRGARNTRRDESAVDVWRSRIRPT